MCCTSILYINKMYPNFLCYIVTEDYKQEFQKLLMNLDPLTLLKINEHKTGNGLKHFPYICINEFEINERRKLCGLMCNACYF